MKYSALFSVCLAGYATAFPNLGNLAAYLPAERNDIASPVKRQSSSPPQGAGAAPSSPPPFDAAAQLVSVSGEHAWQAPSAADARGECPGLNAMANHGYLPRNGIATIPQFYEACMTVFGMGKDLALFLATYGAVVEGDGISWSIGGKPHTGIGGSHNNYETDSSPLKADLYQYGNLDKLVIPQYKELFNMQPDASTANYNLEVLRDFRGSRFNESIAKNPKFFYGPFSGMLVSQAAFTFIYRFMANKSAEYPEGILNQDVLKSFMSISGTDDKPVWKPYQERIPENWYTRNSADYYTIQYCDIGYFSSKYPEINDIGCNQGKVNTFEAINTSNLTSGAYTSEQAAANPLCFGLEYALAELPSLTGLGATALKPLTSLLDGVTSTLGCTAITNLNTNVFDICPGGLAVYGGPTAKRAKGAIRSRDVESEGEEADGWCC